MLRIRPRAVILTLFVLLAGAFGGRADHPKRVLLIYESESTLLAARQLASGFGEYMDANAAEHIEYYTEYLDTLRFSSTDHSRRVAEFLEAKYGQMDLNVVVTGGPGALRFVLEMRERLAKGVPVVFGAVTEGSVAENLPADVKGVVSRFDLGKTVQLASRLQPRARKVVVMYGSAPFDRKWGETALAVLGERYAGLDVEYVSGLSIDGFRKTAAGLSSDAALVILTVFQDAEGTKFVPRDAARTIAEASGAPVYTVYSSYFGKNVVGGYVGTFQSVGAQMAALALEMMRGDLSAPRTTPARETAIVDWGEVQRLGIDDVLIPEDAEILSYSPSAWERYRVPISAALLVIAAQMLTIAALVYQNQRGRRLEATLASERVELAHLSRRSQLGELSGAFAHELTQPLTSILANAEAGQKLATEPVPDMDEIRAIFDDIAADDRRASSVISQLRSMMLKGEATQEILDLNEAVRQTVALARAEMVARRTEVEVQDEFTSVRVKANLVQLQQVILNLLVNAADAMADIPPRQRRVEIAVDSGKNGYCELSVADMGPGIPVEMRSEVFKPFVSSKKGGLGLGLAICRSIVEAQGGKLFFDDGVKRGARAVVILPSA
ncbi:sensor histidine kinase [Sinorhizobium arboris]|uniref:sensor histidine kinase n=1 Tax=Sinorhizobium arboris TaxID=76745 RepID=UPI0012433B8D|nr:ATP-binding protein [Sinorhizobium arboris]